MRRQELISATSAEAMFETVRDYLQLGWRVVPGTVGVTTGERLGVVAWCVVEKEVVEEKSDWDKDY